MSTIEDINNAVEIFRSNKCDFELMHCVSTYPMKIEHANLYKIQELQNKFNCSVGYSGHEDCLSVSYAAAMMGITSLERHVTLSRSMYGSDQSSSLELRGMTELISVIERMRIACTRYPLDYINYDEIKVAEKLRSHLKGYDVKKHLVK